MKLARVCVQRAQRGSLLLGNTRAVLARPSTYFVPRRSYASASDTQANAAGQVDLAEAYPRFVEKAAMYHGISEAPFPPEISNILMAPLDHKDIEIKPDGLIYLPEIRYRRILNRAFGPGAWGLMPIGAPIVERANVLRTYALFCHGRFVSEATGEQPFFEGVSSTATASEAAKSNALVRCCKDLGVGSELWDPQFIVDWKRKYAVEVQCDNQRSKDRKRLWRRIDRPPFEWPWKEVRAINQPAQQPKMPLETGADPFTALEDTSSAPVEESEFIPSPPPRQYQQQPPPPQQQQQQYQQQYQQQQPARQYQRPATQARQTQAPPQPPTPPTPTPPTPTPAPPAAPVAQPEQPAVVEKSKGKRSSAASAASAAAAAQAAPPAATELGWDLDAKLPAPFKTHAGKTWRDMLDPKSFRYVRWAAMKMTGPPQQQAIGFVAFVEQNGGEKAALAKFAQ